MNLKCPLCQTIDESREKWRQNYDLAVENTTLEQTARLKAEAEVSRLTDQRDTCWKDADTALIEDNIRLRGEIIHLKKVVEHTGAVAGAVARTLAGYEAANVRLRETLEWALGFAADDYMLKQKIRAALDVAGKEPNGTGG